MSAADALADRARVLISAYCVEHCTALCCKRGFLVVSGSEAASFGKPDTSDALIDIRNGCPLLLGKLCSKYDVRPHLCREYPLFVKSSAVWVSLQCPAITAGLFDAFEGELIALGLRIEKI